MGAIWAGPYLFLGRLTIGKVIRDDQQWHGFSYLPGAAQVLGPFQSEHEARETVEKSANSRIKAMFGAGIKTTTAAVEEGRELRVLARAIWRAGVWTCDRPVDSAAMFKDLGRALGMDPDLAPRPVSRTERQQRVIAAQDLPADAPLVE